MVDMLSCMPRTTASHSVCRILNFWFCLGGLTMPEHFPLLTLLHASSNRRCC